MDKYGDNLNTSLKKMPINQKGRQDKVQMEPVKGIRVSASMPEQGQDYRTPVKPYVFPSELSDLQLKQGYKTDSTSTNKLLSNAAGPLDH